MRSSYFSLVGTSPLAVANSFAWFTRLHTEAIDNVFFIVSEGDKEVGTKGTEDLIDEVIPDIEDNLQHFNPDLLKGDDRIILNEEPFITIPEVDLQNGCKIIIEEVFKMTKDYEEVYLDVTGGRKTMTGMNLIAALYLQNQILRFNKIEETANLTKLKKVNIVYYWLIPYGREYFSRKAYELGRDDIEIKVFSALEIDKTLRGIEFG